MGEIAEFLAGIVSLISSFLDTIATVTEMIDGIQFNDWIVVDYIGYARFAMGTTLWVMFCTILLIPLGVTIFIYMLKGIAHLKTLLPW